MKTILYWFSMSSTFCSEAATSSYFLGGTVISAMETVMAARVECL